MKKVFSALILSAFTLGLFSSITTFASGNGEIYNTNFNNGYSRLNTLRKISAFKPISSSRYVVTYDKNNKPVFILNNKSDIVLVQQIPLPYN